MLVCLIGCQIRCIRDSTNILFQSSIAMTAEAGEELVILALIDRYVLGGVEVG